MNQIKDRLADTNLVTVFCSSDQARAGLVRNMLLDHGIDAVVSGALQGGFTGALPVEVMVRESDVSSAIMLIDQHFWEG